MALIEAAISTQVPADKPKLRIVGGGSTPQPEVRLNPVTRRAHLQCIRTWKHFRNMHMLVDLACAGRSGPWELDDAELSDLYERMREAADRGLNGIDPDEDGFFKVAG